MKNIKNYQNGFALSGSILAWSLGLASLFGGASYIANKKIESRIPAQPTTNNTSMKSNRNNKNHNFRPDTGNLDIRGEDQLSIEERDGLIIMREEEKLARDVYRTLYEKWGLEIFQNISYSENRHTIAVGALLDAYGIADPVKDDTTGMFTIDEMQLLYNDLITKGNTSLVDALIVGATIEDLDISDLNRLMLETENEDILRVYENLNRGSRNHMRSFVGQLEKQGSYYSAQYLSQDQIDTIVNSEKEKGSHANKSEGNYGQKKGSNHLQKK